MDSIELAQFQKEEEKERQETIHTIKIAIKTFKSNLRIILKEIDEIEKEKDHPILNLDHVYKLNQWMEIWKILVKKERI